MTLVCLYNIVPAGKEALVCAEERLLEIETDGDKHDSHESKSGTRFTEQQ